MSIGPFARTGLRNISLVMAMALAPAAAARAQTPAPAPAPAPEPPPRLEASGQFTFLDTRGNATSQSLGTGGDFVWRPAPWTYSAKAIFAQTESDDELSARSLSAVFRAARQLNQRLSAYGQYDFLRDVFAGVEHRHVVEGGLSYLAVDRAPHRLQFDTGLGYLYEKGPLDHFDSATWSLGAAYKLAISPTSEFRYEPRYLLPLGEVGAWKFDQNVALAVGINTILSLKVSHTLRYSADPPEGFDKTDTIMAISLVAKVKRP